MKYLEKVEVRSSQELRYWLASHFLQEQSVWLVSHKKSKPNFYLPWGDIVDQLLCFGWIDGLIKKLDDHRTMRLISKRKKNSVWSLINKQKVSRLTKAGHMTSAGQEVIDRAKKDGSWSFLDEIDRLILPKDLISELNGYPRARENFDGFSKSIKHEILYWIKSAKKKETRENRIIETAFLASEGISVRHM